MLVIALVLGLLMMPLGAPGVQAMEPSFSAGTAFTYQGNLRQDGNPANGVFDLSFSLFDSGREGATFGQIDLFDVPVRGGAFTVELDFRRPVFSGDKLWLETEVRVAGEGTYSRLEPRDLLLGKAGTTCAVDNDVLISGTLDIEPQLQEPGLEISCCNEADLDGGGQIALHGDSITDPAVLRIDYDELQSSKFGLPHHLQLNPHGGNIGLGVSNPAHPVHVGPGPDVTASGGGALVVGFSSNIAIDQNEIQAHSLGAPSSLYLNNEGGDVVIGGSLGVGLSIQGPEAPLHLPPGPGASATGGGSLVVGYSTNVAIDQNEIQAHAAGGPALLRVNRSGGDVRIGGPSGGLLDIGVMVVRTDSDDQAVTAQCPAGSFLISGGCEGVLDLLRSSYPEDSTTWSCFFDDIGADNYDHHAYAICGRIAW